MQDDHNVPFEGASSFTAHSKQVSQAFKSAATSAGLPNESLSASDLREETFHDEAKRRSETLYELPAMPLVLTTLRAAKSKAIDPRNFSVLTFALLFPANPNRFFTGLSDLNVTSLTDMCQKLYFPIEDCSTAFVTVVNAGLWNLFNNFGQADRRRHGLEDLEFERARALCKRNLDEAISRTPLLLELWPQSDAAGFRHHCQPTYSYRGARELRFFLLLRRRRAGAPSGRRIRTALFGPCPVRERRYQSPACPSPCQSSDTLA